MNFENWLLFAFIALIAAITPGPAILLLTTNAISYGLRKALACILGNITGLLVMSALSVLGLSTVILMSSAVFISVKLIGAAYLIYLGFRLWRFGFGTTNVEGLKVDNQRKSQSFIKLYTQGLFVALSNPKAIAFTTALFPQFINPDAPLAPQFLILVVTIMFLSFICLLSYGYLAVSMKSRSAESSVSQYLSKAFGSAFIASGILLVGVSQK